MAEVPERIGWIPVLVITAAFPPEIPTRVVTLAPVVKIVLGPNCRTAPEAVTLTPPGGSPNEPV